MFRRFKNDGTKRRLTEIMSFRTLYLYMKFAKLNLFFFPLSQHYNKRAFGLMNNKQLLNDTILRQSDL